MPAGAIDEASIMIYSSNTPAKAEVANMLKRQGAEYGFQGAEVSVLTRIDGCEQNRRVRHCRNAPPSLPRVGGGGNKGEVKAPAGAHRMPPRVTTTKTTRAEKALCDSATAASSTTSWL